MSDYVILLEGSKASPDSSFNFLRKGSFSDPATSCVFQSYHHVLYPTLQRIVRSGADILGGIVLL